jgi:nucleoside-diphosphate-sugar epimerase
MTSVLTSLWDARAWSARAWWMRFRHVALPLRASTHRGGMTHVNENWRTARGRRKTRASRSSNPTSPGKLQKLLSTSAGVFHLAAQPGVRSSWGQSFSSYLTANVPATQRLLEAVAEAGVRTVVASSSSVYGAAERYPTSEALTPNPHLTVRRHEAHLRASRGPMRLSSASSS